MLTKGPNAARLCGGTTDPDGQGARLPPLRLLLEERGRRLPTSSGRQAGPRLSVAIPPATGNHSMCCPALTEWPILAVEHLLCANEKLMYANEKLLHA